MPNATTKTEKSEKMISRVEFHVIQGQETDYRYNSGLNLFFGLNGVSTVYIGNASFKLEPEGILTINPHTLYRAESYDSSLLLLHVPEGVLDMISRKKYKNYACYIRDGNNMQPEFDRIRELCAGVLYEYLQNKNEISFSPMGDLAQLLRYLSEHSLAADYYGESGFPGAESSGSRTISRARAASFLQYIDSHWDEDLSLTALSNEVHFSVSYMSKFFKRTLGLSFSEYLRKVRMIHARRMLKGDSSITQIAHDCGFNNASVFIESFRQEHGMTPGQYRQAEAKNALSLNGSDTSRHSHDQRSDFSVLLSHLSEKKEEMTSTREEVVEINERKVNRRYKNANKPWERMVNIGYAKDGLLSPVREQLRRAQDEIGFSWFRCHGLLDDDMYVYMEGSDGTPEYSFTYIDMLFDFITELGLRPYVELSFMPSAIAVRQTKIFDRPSVISGCSNLDKWKDLIRSLLEHLTQRYGADSLEKWRFSTISLSYVRIGCLDPEEYKALYKATYQSIKEFNPSLQFGGTGIFPDLIENEEIGTAWMLEFATSSACAPDFLSMQYYPCIQTDDELFMEYTLNQAAAPALLSRDPDYLADRLDAIEKLMNTYGLNGRELFLEECNSTLWQRDLSGDTCYKAVWLAKNISTSAGRAVFGYWLLTDFIEERAGIQSIFHGGYGLMTYNGIPKAGYQALRMISKMGQTAVDSGDYWFLSKATDGSYTLLIYNYSHYSDLNCYRYKQLDRPEDAYNVFNPGEKIIAHFQIHGLEGKRYRTTRCFLNRENGSSFDQWLCMMAPSYPSKKDAEYLSMNVKPQINMEITEHFTNQPFTIDVSLQPLEMELIILEETV